MTTQHDGVRPKTTTETRLAPLYRVIIHNDDVTPMGVVVGVLRLVFPMHLSLEEAIAVMLEAHNTGVALVCVETLEQAEFHVAKAHGLAREETCPLTFSMERDV
jgi:ATP-dependent Clp protease adaptor protein ClpS